MNKIEQLIQKYKKLLSEVPQKLDSIDAGFTVAFVMIIEDLQSLQEPTEEREVEIDRNDSIINMKYKITC